MPRRVHTLTPLDVYFEFRRAFIDCPNARIFIRDGRTNPDPLAYDWMDRYHIVTVHQVFLNAYGDQQRYALNTQVPKSNDLFTVGAEAGMARREWSRGTSTPYPWENHG